MLTGGAGCNDDDGIPYFDWHSIDWAYIRTELSRYANSQARRRGGFANGRSPEDWVQETMLAMLMSRNGFGWAPKPGIRPEDDISILLKYVLEKRLLDHIRRDKKVHPAGTSLLASMSEKERGFAEIEIRESLLQLTAEIGLSKAEGEKLVEAVYMGTLDDGSHINQQLAEVLGKTTTEVVNMKKRVQRAATKEARKRSQ